MQLVQKFKSLPLRRQWLVFGGVALFAYLFFVHPDVIETSNHSWLLLDSIFKGRFMDFYAYVAEHPYKDGLYYINNAHYNIFIYAIFALAELPVYAVTALVGAGINEPLLYFIGKLVSAGFFVACIPLVVRIAGELGFSDTDRHYTALAFALFPPAFFSAMVMGQYDSICLFFMLLGVLNWLRGRMLPFALWFGVGAACKFFPLLVFIPLLLLKEKRPLHIVKYGLISLWLVAPTILLFMGRTGDMNTFNNLMVQRLFAAKLPAAANIPIFPLLYLLLCFFIWLWRPKEETLGKAGIWAAMAALGLLFIFVDWHPQWIILIAPFLLLTTFAEKRRLPWFWIDVALSASFFLWGAVTHAHQLEANLLDFGLIGIITNLHTTSHAYNPILYYLELLPVITALPMILFAGAVTAHLVFKAPAGGGTLAGKLTNRNDAFALQNLPRAIWLAFAVGIGVWLLPTLFTWLKCFGLI